MKFVSPTVLLGLPLLLSGCGQKPPLAPAPAPAPPRVAPGPPATPGWPATNAQPRLATLKLLIGNQVITAELCRRPVEVMTGMMFRTNMAEEEGMLFALPRPQQASFYMRNTLVPLTLAYINAEGRILELHDLEPRNETPVRSSNFNIQYVLEMKQGWFARHGVVPGATIVTEQGLLKDTVKFIGPEEDQEQ